MGSLVSFGGERGEVEFEGGEEGRGIERGYENYRVYANISILQHPPPKPPLPSAKSSHRRKYSQTISQTTKLLLPYLEHPPPAPLLLRGYPKHQQSQTPKFQPQATDSPVPGKEVISVKSRFLRLQKTHRFRKEVTRKKIQMPLLSLHRSDNR